MPVLSESGSGYYSGGIASVSGNFLKDATSKVYDGSVSGVVEIGDEATLKKSTIFHLWRGGCQRVTTKSR
ncbi:MAG: hypothetical protein L6V85_04570 [Clostridiales bacterium]|nr:MAG: hypothetical protein L6V85_04570 [Clostridiales bacterium]